MRILLDTNVIIHREASNVVISSIGVLFRWLDKLKCEKWIHPATLDEINRHQDPRVVNSFAAKLRSYHTLRFTAPDTSQVAAIRAQFDRTGNDKIDSDL